LLKLFVNTACISELTWKRVPDSGSGDRENAQQPSSNGVVRCWWYL